MNHLDNKRVVHKGMAGHFICADRCCWHLQSIIDGRWMISSVGCMHDYRSEAPKSYDNRVEIGCGRLYETMVFDLEVSSCSEIDMEGYNEESDADSGHFLMVEKWLKKTEETK